MSSNESLGKTVGTCTVGACEMRNRGFCTSCRIPCESSECMGGGETPPLPEHNPTTVSSADSRPQSICHRLSSSQNPHTSIPSDLRISVPVPSDKGRASQAATGPSPLPNSYNVIPRTSQTAMIEGQGRKLLRALNSRYIYGRVVRPRILCLLLPPALQATLIPALSTASPPRIRIPNPDGGRYAPYPQIQLLLCH